MSLSKTKAVVVQRFLQLAVALVEYLSITMEPQDRRPSGPDVIRSLQVIRFDLLSLYNSLYFILEQNCHTILAHSNFRKICQKKTSVERGEHTDV